MTTYVIVHTARTGSNWLCEMLSMTGVAGINDPETCGMFIGYGDLLSTVYPQALNDYFKRATTKNGVCGMKTDWGYLGHLADHLGNKSVDNILGRFTHFIHLSREDVYAQTASLYLAHKTGIFTSKTGASPKMDYIDVPYDFQELLKRYNRITLANAKWEAWFQEHGIEPWYTTYETLARRPVTEVREILQFLGVKPPSKIETSGKMQKQEYPQKMEFAARFKEDLDEYFGVPSSVSPDSD